MPPTDAAADVGSEHLLAIEPSSLPSAARRKYTPHFLFSPLHYEPNYSYPLVVWLHGCGGNERELAQVMPNLSTRNYVAVAPRGSEVAPGNGGYSNAGFDWSDDHYGADEGLERIRAAVAAARKQLNIADDRVFLVGYHSGGTLAMRIALKHPQLFAGVANIGGRFPRGEQPLQNLAAARSQQILTMYGEESSIYDAQDLCADLPLFHTAGLKMSIRQYPGDGELTTQMLHDLNIWLMERVTGQSEAAPSSDFGGWQAN